MKMYFPLVILGIAFAAQAEFKIEDKGGSLLISEGTKPVLVYHYAKVDPPRQVGENYARSCYIHPLYGLDGEVLTQDFPADHLHHRGVFWSWPECRSGDRQMDVWTLPDAHQIHQDWVKREATADKAEVGVKNIWTFDEAPDLPVVEEQVSFTVNKASDTARAIDFVMTFKNVSQEDFTFLGAKDKGYGGFCYRPDAAFKPFKFTTAKGEVDKDQLLFETAWADVSFATRPDGPKVGLAIFQNPSNPGYPSRGWMMRHYAFLGASWPHVTPHVLKPGESFTLKYRLYIHKGSAADARLAEQFRAYAEAK
jgi:hypothetical protein